MRLVRSPIAWLVAWTLFVWVTRTRNILGDDELSTAAAAWRLAVSVLFVALAAGVVVARRTGQPDPGAALAVFVVWTIGYWLVRGVQIIAADHDLGFTAVHTVLMVVSIALAAWAWSERAG